MSLADFGEQAEKAAVTLMQLGVSLEGNDTAVSDIRKAETEMCGTRGSMLGLVTNLSLGEVIDFQELNEAVEKYWILKKYITLRAVTHI